jgi:molybdopterin biosynthesis enzyme MoaB
MGPRDVTPQTLHGLLDYEIPGFGEQMRAYGRTQTPMADISRSLAGVLASTLVIAMPGSPGGALDSLTAIEPVLDHALETLGGHTQHARAGSEEERRG